MLKTFLDELAVNQFRVVTLNNLYCRKTENWASTMPEISRASRPRPKFKPLAIGHSLIAEMFKKPAEKTFSNMEALKASRQNRLLFYLVENQAMHRRN